MRRYSGLEEQAAALRCTQPEIINKQIILHKVRTPLNEESHVHVGDRECEEGGGWGVSGYTVDNKQIQFACGDLSIASEPRVIWH